jgi:cation diffusion facilitator family transporter
VFVAVCDRDADALVFDGTDRRQAFAESGGSVVTEDTSEARAFGLERVEDGFGGKIARVEDEIGLADSVECSTVEAVGVKRVRVGNDGDHSVREIRLERGRRAVGISLFDQCDDVMASNKSVVIAALLANAVIAVLKFVGFLLTGSAAMLSEVYHSISDTGNQIFLLIGIRYSSRETDRKHPFGYGKAQFFYSFLVAVLLFGIAGWESVTHGYSAIMHPQPVAPNTVSRFGHTIPAVWVNYAVLIGAIVFESYALRQAYLGITDQMHEQDWESIPEAFRKTSDVTTLTAFTEDTVAVSGAGIALLGIFLSRVTGNPLFDAVASFVIGLLLMGFALALAWENKRLLLGESLPREAERPLKEIIARWDGVRHIDDFRTVFFGPEQLLVAADISFEDTLNTETIDQRITAIENALMEHDPQVKKVYIEPET